MSVYISDSADGFEAAMKYDRAKGAFMAQSMDDERKALCDGEQHYAFILLDANMVETVRVLSREEVRNDPDRQHLYEYYYGEGEGAKNGYLPCESRSAFDPEPDRGDRHASIMTELTQSMFAWFMLSHWRTDVICTSQEAVDVLNKHVDAMNTAQKKLDVWEAEYEGRKS